MPAMSGPFQSSGFSGEFVSNIKLLNEDDKQNLQRIADFLCVRYGRPGHRLYDVKNRSLFLRACEMVGKARHVYAGNPRVIRHDVMAIIGEQKARALENDVMLGLEFQKRINTHYDLKTDCREEHLLLTALLYNHNIKHNKQGWCWGDGYRYARQYYAPCGSEMLAALAERLWRHADKIYSTSCTGTKLLNKRLLFVFAKNWKNSRSVRVPKAFESKQISPPTSSSTGLQRKPEALRKHEENENSIVGTREDQVVLPEPAPPPETAGDDSWDDEDDPFGGTDVYVFANPGPSEAEKAERARRSWDEMDRFLNDDSW